MILSDEQAMVRETARDFAAERLKPFAAEWDRGSIFPREAIAEMGRLGLMGMLVPEAWGGAASDHVSYALALEEIAAGDGSCSTIMSVHNSVGCMPILKFGSAEQKERFLKPLARGDQLAAFALTEPSAGSDASAIKTRARRVGNHYVLDGTKQFITSGENADLPTTTPGYRVARVEHKLGLHASDTAHLVFDEMALTPDLMLGREGEGYKIALANLEGGRIGIGAQAVGMARAAYEAALDYAKQRQSFGKAIIEHQAIAFRLADMATQIEVARQMVLHAAALRDAGQPCLKEAAMAKLFASEMAERVCSDAIQIHGGYGYLNDFPVERIYRDVRICQIYEGTSDIQRLVISRAIAAE